MRGKITAVLFIIVLLLTVAVVCTFLTEFDKQAENSAAGNNGNNSEIITVGPTPDAGIVETPAATLAPSVTPAVTPTPTPAPEATFEPSPEPTVEPTPSPAPEIFVAETIGSGRFSSQSGALINIHADWTADAISASQVEVELVISLDSYSIHLASADSVFASLDGKFVSLTAPDVNYDGKDMINTTLASTTFVVDLNDGSSGSFPLAVEWHFGGTYGDMFIGSIECGGTIELTR